MNEVTCPVCGAHAGYEQSARGYRHTPRYDEVLRLCRNAEQLVGENPSCPELDLAVRDHHLRRVGR